MLKEIVVILCVASFVRSQHLDLNEGSKCSHNGLDGKCVSIYKCFGAMEEVKDSPLATCNSKNNEPVVCCTDCQLVDDTRKIVIDKSLGRSKLTDDKSYNYCVNTHHKLDLRCKKSKKLIIDRSLDVQKKCLNISPFVSPVNFNVEAYSWKEKIGHLALLGYGADDATAKWKCGGSVVSEKYVITAARCLEKPDLGPVKFIALGVRKVEDPHSIWEIYRVKKVIPHPDFKPPSMYNDLALIETDKQIVFNDHVKPICLPQPIDEEHREATVSAIGGYIYKGQKVPDDPYMLNLVQFSDEECKKIYPPSEQLPGGYNSTTQKCFGARSRKSFCHSDVGATLQISDSVIACSQSLLGVTSFSRTCSLSGGTALYTKVSYYKPWIESILWP